MNDNMYNRIKGALFGVAVGDAIGAPLEMMWADTIKKQYGTVTEMIGGGWLDVKPGEVTDDTQMTLCVADGIDADPENPFEEIGARFVKWFNSRPKDIGTTCACSIRSAMSMAKNPARPSLKNWLDASYNTHVTLGGKSAGNGSLMRTVYPGLYYSEKSRAIEVARTVSSMTHHDKLAENACAFYADVLYSLVPDDDALSRWLRIASSGYNRVFDKGYKPKPSGYVIDGLEAAVYCILTTDSFENAIVKTVNLGGDADTIGAIAGGLAGALYGFDAIPDRWTACLDKALTDALTALTDEAYKNRSVDT